MFTDTCTRCQKLQLVFASQVTGLDNTDRGPVLHYTCWCGEPQSWLPHGGPAIEVDEADGQDVEREVTVAA